MAHIIIAHNYMKIYRKIKNINWIIIWLLHTYNYCICSGFMIIIIFITIMSITGKAIMTIMTIIFIAIPTLMCRRGCLVIFDQTPQTNNSTLSSGDDDDDYNGDGEMVMVTVTNMLINELCQKHSFEFRVPQYTPLPVHTLQKLPLPSFDPFYHSTTWPNFF